MTLLDFIQRMSGMYVVGQRVWYRGKQPAFMVDGVIEYTPKMLMNYGRTEGGKYDKSKEEIETEINQRNHPLVKLDKY